MASKEKLARINALAKKAKTDSGLNSEEKAEQLALRKEYLAAFRGQIEEHLHQVTIVDPDGNDVTPEKLRESKRARQEQS